MNSLKTLLLTKSLIAAAIATGSLAVSGVASSATIGGSPDDGVICRAAPKTYNASSVNNKFFCKRTLNVTQALTCPIGFPTKFIREGPGGGGKDVCAANGRVYPANVALTGTVGVDYVFLEVGSTQVSTIIANQRQLEATAMGLTLDQVDARALSSAIVINHPNFGSEDRLQVNLEFATFAIPAPGGIVVGGPVLTSPTPFVPRPLP